MVALNVKIDMTLVLAVLLGVALISLALGLPQPFWIILSLSKSENMVWFCCAKCIVKPSCLDKSMLNL